MRSTLAAALVLASLATVPATAQVAVDPATIPDGTVLDIVRLGANLDILVVQGAKQIDGPKLSLDQPDAALDEARIDAIKQARARADLYARAAGLSVARIMTISESGANAPTPPMPMYVARSAGLAKAATMIAPGETDVTVTVSVRFLLK